MWCGLLLNKTVSFPACKFLYFLLVYMLLLHFIIKFLIKEIIYHNSFRSCSGIWHCSGSSVGGRGGAQCKRLLFTAWKPNKIWLRRCSLIMAWHVPVIGKFWYWDLSHECAGRRQTSILLWTIIKSLPFSSWSLEFLFKRRLNSVLIEM